MSDGFIMPNEHSCSRSNVISRKFLQMFFADQSRFLTKKFKPSTPDFSGFLYFRSNFYKMIKILTIVGARPQIIKAAALSRTIRNSFSNMIQELILHTGQHYDENMSQVFFDELNIPRPDFNLEVGSASHGVQTARMITGIEEKLLGLRPGFLVLYGDTNSTLAGAIAASKLQIPVVHIEAGLRSFNKSMPEEINRIMCDHVSTLLFSPTETGIRNLRNEGFRLNTEPPFTMDNPGVFHCGDVMYDNSLHFAEIAAQKSRVLDQFGAESGKYILCTIHRNNNTDDPKRLSAIFRALNRIGAENQTDIILPLHPRTTKMMKQNLDPDLMKALEKNPYMKTGDPVSFLDIIQLERNAKMVITDSGGVQKEAYFFKKPGIILRPQTEWVELVKSGTAIIADAEEKRIVEAYAYFSEKQNLAYPEIFGDGRASEFICKQLIKATEL